MKNSLVLATRLDKNEQTIYFSLWGIHSGNGDRRYAAIEIPSMLSWRWTGMREFRLSRCGGMGVRIKGRIDARGSSRRWWKCEVACLYSSGRRRIGGGKVWWFSRWISNYRKSRWMPYMLILQNALYSAKYRNTEEWNNKTANIHPRACDCQASRKKIEIAKRKSLIQSTLRYPVHLTTADILQNFS